jgi:hypothetical protein
VTANFGDLRTQQLQPWTTAGTAASLVPRASLSPLIAADSSSSYRYCYYYSFHLASFSLPTVVMAIQHCKGFWCGSNGTGAGQSGAGTCDSSRCATSTIQHNNRFDGLGSSIRATGRVSDPTLSAPFPHDVAAGQRCRLGRDARQCVVYTEQPNIRHHQPQLATDQGPRHVWRWSRRWQASAL